MQTLQNTLQSDPYLKLNCKPSKEVYAKKKQNYSFLLYIKQLIHRSNQFTNKSISAENNQKTISAVMFKVAVLITWGGHKYVLSFYTK